MKWGMRGRVSSIGCKASSEGIEEGIGAAEEEEPS